MSNRCIPCCRPVPLWFDGLPRLPYKPFLRHLRVFPASAPPSRLCLSHPWARLPFAASAARGCLLPPCCCAPPLCDSVLLFPPLLPFPFSARVLISCVSLPARLSPPLRSRCTTCRPLKFSPFPATQVSISLRIFERGCYGRITSMAFLPPAPLVPPTFLLIFSPFFGFIDDSSLPLALFPVPEHIPVFLFFCFHLLASIELTTFLRRIQHIVSSAFSSLATLRSSQPLGWFRRTTSPVFPQRCPSVSRRALLFLVSTAFLFLTAPFARLCRLEQGLYPFGHAAKPLPLLDTRLTAIYVYISLFFYPSSNDATPFFLCAHFFCACPIPPELTM